MCVFYYALSKILIIHFTLCITSISLTYHFCFGTIGKTTPSVGATEEFNTPEGVTGEQTTPLGGTGRHTPEGPSVTQGQRTPEHVSTRQKTTIEGPRATSGGIVTGEYITTLLGSETTKMPQRTRT